jgi:uncharacterized protein YjbJ (UPF0337 family)
VEIKYKPVWHGALERSHVSQKRCEKWAPVSTVIKENGMNKDRVEGKLKDVAGRIERQAGEWTGDAKKQVEGVAKQVEGKVQNAVGKIKDAAKKESDDNAAAKPPQRVQDSVDSEEETGEIRRSGR